jgi:hypothetical protein
MGAPFPSSLSPPQVRRARERRRRRLSFTLDHEIRPYTLRAPAPSAGAPLVVQLDAPTWCRAGETRQQACASTGCASRRPREALAREPRSVYNVVLPFAR